MAPRRTRLRAFGYRSSVSPNKGLSPAPLECDLVTNETAFTVPISRLDEPACGLRPISLELRQELWALASAEAMLRQWFSPHLSRLAGSDRTFHPPWV
jgi:hypothetical protein